ncbi:MULTISPECIES: hypothetical protein [unclassified Streptomyces]|uniref:hypothetical protein n=1 Tax=unclassified Streptomyces TaxID=2593676 RepID=UPI001900F0E0|nr:MULTISPECIES: hypothetical protein [unclassified Streptomyces]MBK0373882.1 hypothetical protein [Streptomyces sp. RB110-1]MBK0389750.1 hypothetical protein [Streptomyces sp. RB110-2]
MSSHHSIFIHPGHPVDALVGDVALACGGRLRPTVNGPADYILDLGDATLELETEHEYEEDKGVPFERYEVVLTVRDSDGDMEREQVTARQIFHELAVLRRYWLVLVFDLQAVIDTAAPPGQRTFPAVRDQ